MSDIAKILDEIRDATGNGDGWIATRIGYKNVSSLSRLRDGTARVMGHEKWLRLQDLHQKHVGGRGK
jgi:hypothetical protein